MRALALLVILIPSILVLIFFIVKSLLFPQHIEALPNISIKAPERSGGRFPSCDLNRLERSERRFPS